MKYQCPNPKCRRTIDADDWKAAKTYGYLTCGCGRFIHDYKQALAAPFFVPEFARQKTFFRRAICAAFQIPERLLPAKDTGGYFVDNHFFLEMLEYLRKHLHVCSVHQPTKAELTKAIALLYERPKPLQDWQSRWSACEPLGQSTIAHARDVIAAALKCEQAIALHRAAVPETVPAKAGHSKAAKRPARQDKHGRKPLQRGPSLNRTPKRTLSPYPPRPWGRRMG